MTEEFDKEDNIIKEPNNQRSKKQIIIEISIYIAIILFSVFIVPKYIVQRTVVNGKSMEDTLHNRESLLVEKVSYRFHGPRRFDIIVFYPYGRQDEDDYYVKRVIGLPGETIQIIGDDIYINGSIIEEDYGKETIIESGIAAQPLKLGDDEYFVMGDNRRNSLDSRYSEVGPVKRENIEGRVVLRIYPFNKMKVLTH